MRVRVLTRLVRNYSNRKHNPRVAVVGSGPSGFYFTGSLRKLLPGAHVDILEADPVPFGLVRFGVAPDHPEVKNCTHQFESYVSKSSGLVSFYGGVRVGRDLSVEELRQRYDAVVFCYGSSRHRKLATSVRCCDDELIAVIQGEAVKELSYPNFCYARPLVEWYNGHPDAGGHRFEHFAELVREAENVTIIGLGNVALDVARILLSDPHTLEQTDISDDALEALGHSHHRRQVTLVGRRGPTEAAFTIKEFREMLKLPGIGSPRVGLSADFDAVSADSIKGLPRGRQRLASLMLKANKESPVYPQEGRWWDMRFFRSPVAFHLAENGTITGVEYSVNRLEAGAAVDCGERETIPTDLVVTSLGYKTLPLEGVPFDDAKSTMAMEKDGYHVKGMEDCFSCGWCAHGPNGTSAFILVGPKVPAF